MKEAPPGFSGSATLLRTLLRQVAYGEILVPAGTNQDILLEDIPELFHSFYIYDAYHITDPGGGTVDIILHGPGIIEAGGAQHTAGVGVTLYKRRKTGAAAAVQIEVRLLISNPLSGDVNISYEVFRIAGLK